MSINKDSIVLSEIFADYSERIFLILPDGARVSYGDFWQKSKLIAARLAELGVVAGDRLLISLENSDDFLRLYVAAAIIGAVACPLDPASPAIRVTKIKRDLQPKLVIDLSSLSSVLTPPTGTDSLPLAADQDREFVIIYSSGTTGEPKGIVHTIRSLLSSAQSFSALSELGEGAVVYHHFPMYYMAGVFNMFLCPMVAGAAIVLGPKFSNLQMMRFWELPRKYGVNHLTLTPTMAMSLCQLYRTDDSLLEHVGKYQAVISTGSYLYQSIAKRFLETFQIPLRSCYGVTEIGGSITLQSWAEALAQDSVGRFSPEVSIQAGSKDQPAEVLVKTPFMMKGYLVGGEIDSSSVDGFFKTGDIGYVCDDQLYLTGRENDLVKKGGEFVSLALIENLALSNEQITDVAVVAVPDEFWGNRLVLFYVPVNGAVADEIEKNLLQSFSDGLRKIEHPNKMIPVPFMPKTSIGKVVKRDLLARYTV